MYGIRGAANTSSTGPDSTAWPAYMTMTWSATPATTPRSWLIRIIAAPVWRRTPASMSRICACTVTSSAVVGSSAMSRSGSLAMAIAMTTRWRMPPDSSCGYRLAIRSGPGRPAASSRLTARRQASCRDTLRCSSTHSATCQPTLYIGFSAVIGSWNTIAIFAPRIRCHCASLPPSSSVPDSRTDPVTCAAPGSRPSTDRASMVLPEPDSPTTPRVWPAARDSDTPRTASTRPPSVGMVTARSVTSSRVPGGADGGTGGPPSAPACQAAVTACLSP